MEHFDFLVTDKKLIKLFPNVPSSLFQLSGVAVNYPPHATQNLLVLT